jgi:hypothetical protein
MYDVKSLWGWGVWGAGVLDCVVWETSTGIDAMKLSEPVPLGALGFGVGCAQSPGSEACGGSFN